MSEMAGLESERYFPGMLFGVWRLETVSQSKRPRETLLQHVLQVREALAFDLVFQASSCSFCIGPHSIHSTNTGCLLCGQHSFDSGVTSDSKTMCLLHIATTFDRDTVNKVRKVFHAIVVIKQSHKVKSSGGGIY